MDTDVYDEKIKDMQKHIPFLENLIASLKKEKNDKEKEAQLNKMQMLHAVLTQNNKRIKIEALDRCESILLKVQEVYKTNGLLNGDEDNANSKEKPETKSPETENLNDKKNVTDTTKKESVKQIQCPIDEIDEAKRNELLVTEIQLDPTGTSGKPKIIYFIKKDTKKESNATSDKIRKQLTAPTPPQSQSKPIDIVELSSDDDDVILVSEEQPIKKPIEKSPNSKAACATFFKGIGLREVNKPSLREQLLQRKKARNINQNQKSFNFKINNVCTVSSSSTPLSSFKNGNTNINRNLNTIRIQNNRIQNVISGKAPQPLKRPQLKFGKFLTHSSKTVSVQPPFAKVATVNTNYKLLTPVVQNNDELGLLTPLRIENYNNDHHSYTSSSSGSGRTRNSNRNIEQEISRKQLSDLGHKVPVTDSLSDSVPEAEEEQYQPRPKRLRNSSEYAEIKKRYELAKLRIEKFLTKIFKPPKSDIPGILEMLKEEVEPKHFDQMKTIIEMNLALSRTAELKENVHNTDKAETSNTEENLTKSQIDSEMMDLSTKSCIENETSLTSITSPLKTDVLTHQNTDLEMSLDSSIQSNKSENLNELTKLQDDSKMMDLSLTSCTENVEMSSESLTPSKKSENPNELTKSQDDSEMMDLSSINYSENENYTTSPSKLSILTHQDSDEEISPKSLTPQSEKSEIKNELTKSQDDSEMMALSSTNYNENENSATSPLKSGLLSHQNSNVEISPEPTTPPNKSENSNETVGGVSLTTTSAIKTILDDAEQPLTPSCISPITTQLENQSTDETPMSMKVSENENTASDLPSPDIQNIGSTLETSTTTAENLTDNVYKDSFSLIKITNDPSKSLVQTTQINSTENQNKGSISRTASQSGNQDDCTETITISSSENQNKDSKSQIHHEESISATSSIKEGKLEESSTGHLKDQHISSTSVVQTTPIKATGNEKEGSIPTTSSQPENQDEFTKPIVKSPSDNQVEDPKSENQQEESISATLSIKEDQLEESSTSLSKDQNVSSTSVVQTTPINAPGNEIEGSSPTASSQPDNQDEFTKPIVKNQIDDPKSENQQEESMSATLSIKEAQLEESTLLIATPTDNQNEDMDTSVQDSSTSVSSKSENQNNESSPVTEMQSENNHEESLVGGNLKSAAANEDTLHTAIPDESTNLPENQNTEPTSTKESINLSENQNTESTSIKGSTSENKNDESSKTLNQTDNKNEISTPEIKPTQETENEESRCLETKPTSTTHSENQNQHEDKEAIDIDKELETIDGMRRTIREILNTEAGRRKFRRMFDIVRKIEYLTFYKRRVVSKELQTVKIESPSESTRKRKGKRSSVSKSDKYIIESAPIDVITPPVEPEEKNDAVAIEKTDSNEEVPGIRKSLRQRIARTRQQDILKEPDPEPEPEPEPMDDEEFIPYQYVPKKESPTKIAKTPKTPKTPKNVPKAKDSSITTVAVKTEKNAEQFPILSNVKRNINRDHHCRSKYLSYCILCKQKQQFGICHYVNKHRDYEVYVARLPQSDVDYLTHNPNLAFAAPPRSSIFLFSSLCVFCKKEMTHPIRYWFEHYTMHTGEYTYQCNACPARRARRNQFRNHWSKDCVPDAEIINLYEIDNRATRIVAYLCADCNYIQLHPEHTFNHLRTQHNIADINETHYRVLILLEVQEHFSEVADDNEPDASNMLLDPSYQSIGSNLSIKMENGHDD